MKKIILAMLLFLACAMGANAVSIIRNATPADTSQWICFRKVINIKGNPAKNQVRIAADSKYWLWVNGKLEVFEGALKRGPNPKDTYVDNITLKNLHQGDNTIAVLLWYFGRPGFSHRDSKCPGLYFDLNVAGTHYGSDASWLTIMHPAYYLPAGEIPNYRLPESNIGFDARKDISDFFTVGFDDSSWQKSVEVDAKTADWNNLVDRSIPMWKDYGMKKYVSQATDGNKWVCKLPYNAQVTPYLKVKAPAGKVIGIRTDDYLVGGVPCVRAEYITKDGEQEYENLGWMNGHEVIYTVPDGVEVLDLGYRETGYDCDFTGTFKCDNPDMNSLWIKAQRTLYLTMRDNYMDCPDRERGQWIGDVSNELVETFYAFTPNANLLTRKAIREVADWQKPDSVMFGPIPAGNWDKELPMQTMAFMGLGAWNYYMGSGDIATLKYINPAMRRYVHKWVLQPDGLVIYRPGAWDWGDWGSNADMRSMCQLWYSITLDSYAKQCTAVGEKAEAEWANAANAKLKQAIQNKLWTGSVYRDPTYKEKTDDRTQSLAVISGVAPKSEYPTLLNFLKETKYASPYMERYVLEAMCDMGSVKDAKDRMLDRFMPMIKSPITTLWEIFTLGAGGEFSGSYNHAWSGGPLIIMSKYIAGISPLKPAFKEFQVKPEMCGLHSLDTTVPTQFGNITVSVKANAGYSLTVRVPNGTKARLCVPADYAKYQLNGKTKNLKKTADGKYYFLNVSAGLYTLKSK
jgi:alpha-L-rhamnosidase